MLIQQQQEWQDILSSVREMSQAYNGGMVVIGGVAVWLHSQKMADVNLLQASHDADFYLSLQDFGTLRSVEEVTANKRLGKYQIIKNGVDFDVYVERNTDLIVPFDAIMAASEIIQDIPCASLGHLLTLKTHAYSDRRFSAKGEKDARDIIKILLLFNENKMVSARSLSFFLEEEWLLVEKVTQQQKLFLDIANGNAYTAKEYRKKALQGLEYAYKAKNSGMDTCTNGNQGGYLYKGPKT